MWAATLRDEAASLQDRLKNGRRTEQDREQMRELAKLLLDAASSIDAARDPVSRRGSSEARTARRRKKRSRALRVQ